MRPRQFDKQLRSVFMVLSGLTILVGLASIGVNRFLVVTQQRVLNDSIAIIERAERVAVDADLAATLAEQLAFSRTDAEIATNAGTLAGRIDRIETDLQAMRRFLGQAEDPLPEPAEARALVARIGDSVRRLHGLDDTISKARDRLTQAGVRLAALVATERDLARLRVTAGLWQMYAAPAGADLRPGLDRLGDVDFFAFERIGELAEATATLTRIAQETVMTPTAPALTDLRAALRGAVALADRRLGFLPSAAARQAAGRDIALFAAADGPAGLIAAQEARLKTQSEIRALSARLDDRLAVLTRAAGSGRDATRLQMRQRIAAAGLRTTVLTGALVAVILAALLVGYLVWLRTRRRVVHRLDAVAERIIGVAQGNPGRPVPISGHDEIGRLEKALNILRRRAEEAARLRKSLESAVLARTADVVAEMHSANAARAEAEEQSRAKTHFLARMSHEIRTPLNGVIGLLDLLAAEEPDPRRRDRLQTALTSARDLQAMTEDILAFSSGEDAGRQVGGAAFDPAQLARSLGEHLGVLARAKGLEVTVDIARDLPPGLWGAATQIRQVVLNLLSNAVKYTETGSVALTVAHRPLPEGLHEIGFVVADTGPGMTAEETRHAFDIYGRSMSARRRGVPGVGLGLAIVRQLTDAMGGELRVSTRPDHGSTFTLVLRLPEAAAPAAPIELAPVPAGLRVLVVDDHPVNRLVARGYLDRMGCDVTEAETGTEAIAAATAERFDLILIDLNLPDLMGDEVARRIGQAAARLVLLTAEPVRDDAATRARFGVDAVLTKPIAPRDLLRVLGGAAAPSTPEPPVSDAIETRLRDDIATLGAPLVADIVAAFLDDLSAAVTALAEAPDAAARRKIAHRIKGAASNFGLTALCDLLRRIEGDDPAALRGLRDSAQQAAAALRGAAGRAGLQLPGAAAKQ